MRITDLRVDGFGVWRGLELEQLSPELNVFYGANEAGKTTLMQFVRAMFYGFSPLRRARYLPPVRGGRPGGQLSVRTSDGAYQITRYEDPQHLDSLGLVRVTSADGASHNGELLGPLLGEMDEQTYNHVFAFGLREIQELGTLTDGQAASLLYGLSIGADRVSLLDVLRELRGSRSRLVNPEMPGGQVPDLVAQVKRLEGEIEAFDEHRHRYWEHFSNRNQLQQQAARLEDESSAAGEQVRLLETALRVRDRWHLRASLDTQLAAVGSTADLPVDGVARFDELSERLLKRRRLWKKARRLRRELRDELATLPLKESLWRQAPRIEALAENEPWLVNLEKQTREAEQEVARLEAQASEHRRRFGLGDGAANQALGSSKYFAPLKSAAGKLRQARRNMLEVKQEVQGSRSSANALKQEIDTTLAKRTDDDLVSSLESTGNLVTQLRRRIQLDDRLDNLARSRTESSNEIRRLLDRQVLPGPVLAGLGGLFIVGLMLVLMRVLLMTGWFESVFPGWFLNNRNWLALLGIVMAGGAAAAKWVLERTASDQLDGAQRQLGMLKLQISQLREEREALDEQLPIGEGHLVTRLQKAEKELAELEELMSLDSKRKEVEQQAGDNRQRVHKAADEFKEARRRWQNALRTAGLPQSLSTAQVRELAEQGDMLGELNRQLETARGLRDQRRAELAAMNTRIGALMAETGLKPEGTAPLALIQQMRRAAKEQESLVGKREESLKRAAKLRRRQKRYHRDITRLLRRRRSLMRAAGAVSEGEFRRRMDEWQRVDLLRRQRQDVQADIETGLGSVPAEAVAALLDADAGSPVDRLSELQKNLDATRRRLQTMYERRGELSSKLQHLADDRQAAHKRLELAAARQRLRAAVERWQTLATTEQLLEQLKNDYEQNRQPETLREASRYLEKLTAGHYRRVWKPLAENVLRVDDASGHALPVEVLSRGTREQLFLSLRLALAAGYAQRGAALPLVLDDVLVNFDIDRARAAAEVLSDFAAEGHQLLVFTCHEHVWKMFRAMRADARRLPSNLDLQPAVILEEPPAKKRRRKDTPVEAVVDELPPAEPEVEVLPEPEPEPIPEPVVQLPEPEPVVEVVEAVVEEPAPPQPVEEPPVEVMDEEQQAIDADLDHELAAAAEEEVRESAAAEQPVVEHQPPVFEPEPLVVLPEPVVVEPPKPRREPPPPRPRKVKRARRVKAPTPVFRRQWEAEEFAGELQDRVSPRWRVDAGHNVDPDHDSEFVEESWAAADDSEAA